MSNYRKLSKVIFLGILTLSLCLLSVQVSFAQTTAAAANLELQAANSAVDAAFTSISAAENAGANITGLITQLNSAAATLAQAENANRTGDYNSAAAEADSVIPIAQQVTSSAVSSLQTANVSSQNALRDTIAFTVIGITVFVVALFAVWRWVKARYIKSLSEAKPEVLD